MKLVQTGVVIARMGPSLNLRISAAIAYSVIVLAAPAHAGSVNAVTDTGKGYAGIASRPIANVAANDTVNGAPATLGASGNAKVATVGMWPTGIGLSTLTGAVSISAALAPGTYTFVYQLCDNNSPPDCDNATDGIAVYPVILANPDSGTAVAGTASTPIVNVAGNDTVNGPAATLGASGNATVAQSGSWPAGIALNTSTGAVTTTTAVPPGTYSIQYQLCDRYTPAHCATATDTVTVTASIVAAPDTGSGVAGTASTPIATVTANDSVNGAVVTLGTSGNATIAPLGSWAAGIALNTLTGAITTTAAVPPGTYNIQYQLCDRYSPPDCATTTDIVGIAAAILPLPDSGSAVAGSASMPIANVAANDSVNGVAAVLGTSGNATVAQSGTWPAGITLAPTGAITTAPSVPPATYSLQYQLCDVYTPPDCAYTTDTVTVLASIVAVPDAGSAAAGTASTPISNVAANDTVNGAPATLGASGNAAVAQMGPWPTGIALNGVTGAVTTTTAVAPGTYNFQYQLCDKNSPPDCAAATDTVTVSISIVANPDTGNAVYGLASTPIANVVANDTVNGLPATLGPSGNATISALGTWPAGATLNTSTGAVSVTSSIPLGTYALQYQLCDLNTSPDCSSTTDTLNVTTATIVAHPDSGTADVGVASRPIVNVAANDSVNGAPATLGSSGNATIAKLGTWPTGIGLNPTTGAVSTTVAVTVGSYSFQYQLCDKNSPPDCASATDTVSVISPIIVPNPDSGTADAGIASRPISNVAANDTVNGAPATLGSGGNATVAAVGPWPAGIALNSTTGAVSTSVAVAAGVYQIQYELCDLNLPATCVSTTDTVTVINVSVVANSDSGTADFGIASQPIANVAVNDTVNGAPATLGTSGNSTISKVGTWATGIGLNPTTGAVSTTVAVPVGVNQIQYQLCDLNTPPNCNSTTDTVTVINASVVANPDSGTADFGVASQPIANVAANDTVNGTPATLGSSGNSTIAKVGTWATGIGLNPTTGAVSTTVTVPTGVYQLQYQLCDLNVPAKCNTATDTVTVINASVVANPDSGTADFGIASQPIANVAANDIVDGVPATLGTSGNARIAKLGTWPSGIGLNSTTGAVSTGNTLADGVYTVQYQICDLNTPANCNNTTDTVTVITASILANPETGTAKAGTPSTAIASVVANDTVNGAQVTLGASGNAQITKVGTWPTGLNLGGTTGAVTTTSALAPGIYDIEYELCDLNVPANCAAAEDEITVTSAIIANPETGTAVSGKAATPIHNVASNDSVNGATARLQTSPNATVSPVGTWPSGIALNTTTGAVTTTAAVPPGSYDFSYQLCDLSTPPNCATAADTIMIDSALVVLPIAGSSVVGTASTAIGNVAAYDIVNGVPATLGSAGNATVAQSGSWPTGIALNPTTGAVTATASVLAGNYKLQYTLCDKNTPPDCASAPANVTVTQQFTEVSVSPYMTGDIEFDWARDGIFCQSCNFGVGNSQVNWTDRQNNLWVSGVDPNTGAFTPISGKGNGTPVDTTAFFWQDWGNGPEWAFSTPPGAPGGNPISQLVYTRYAPGQPPTWEYTGAALATQVDGAPTWQVSFFPGAYTHVLNDTVLPEASQCPSDPMSFTLFQNVYTPGAMFTEPDSTAPGTVPTTTPFGAYANGIGERWVACTTWLTFQGDVTIGTNSLQQVFWYDRVSQVTQQLTFDPTTKQRAVMFRAPEFNGQYVLMTLAADNQIQIYLQNGTLSNGAPNMQLVNTIYSPDPTETFIFNPKVFIHCTAAYPTCRTYVVMGLSAVVNSQQTEEYPNGLGVASIDPNNPMFEILVSASSLPATQRLDPKYFITANGPVVYYNSLLAVTPTQPYEDLGIYMIDMQLGPPSGPCVGSSAHEGLNPTWPTCTAGVPP